MLTSAHKNARGFTLVEMAVVVGVFALILAGLWMLMGVMYERAREHEASLQIQTIVRGMRQLYGRVGTLANGPGTNYTLTFDEQNLYPAEMKINRSAVDGKVNNPWNTGSTGSVTITSANDSNSEATILEIKYTQMPKKACVRLAMQMSEGILEGLNYLKINNGSCYGLTAYCGKEIPITLTNATSECNQSDSASGTGQNSLLLGMSIH